MSLRIGDNVNKVKSKKVWAYRLMVLPGVVLLFMFCYVPMGGIVMAFQNFVPAKGLWNSEWVGLKNFTRLFTLPGIGDVFWNTIVISIAKIILGIIVPVIFAILLNEAKNIGFRRVVQTVVYLPNFISWVILGTVFKQVFGMYGPVNNVITSLGFPELSFLTNGSLFRGLLIGTDVWKNFGFGTIVYLAAILGISPQLYEAARMDGATRWQRIWHVTLPGMKPTIVLMATLALGNVLNGGFEQILNMYNTMVYDKADIIDTFVYRMGLVNVQYSLATAVGLLKSVISAVLIILAHYLAEKFADYRIF